MQATVPVLSMPAEQWKYTGVVAKTQSKIHRSISRHATVLLNEYHTYVSGQQYPMFPSAELSRTGSSCFPRRSSSILTPHSPTRIGRMYGSVGKTSAPRYNMPYLIVPPSQAHPPKSRIFCPYVPPFISRKPSNGFSVPAVFADENGVSLFGGSLQCVAPSTAFPMGFESAGMFVRYASICDVL